MRLPSKLSAYISANRLLFTKSPTQDTHVHIAITPRPAQCHRAKDHEQPDIRLAQAEAGESSNIELVAFRHRSKHSADNEGLKAGRVLVISNASGTTA